MIEYSPTFEKLIEFISDIQITIKTYQVPQFIRKKRVGIFSAWSKLPLKNESITAREVRFNAHSYSTFLCELNESINTLKSEYNFNFPYYTVITNNRKHEFIDFIDRSLNRLELFTMNDSNLRQDLFAEEKNKIQSFNDTLVNLIDDLKDFFLEKIENLRLINIKEHNNYSIVEYKVKKNKIPLNEDDLGNFKYDVDKASKVSYKLTDRPLKDKKKLYHTFCWSNGRNITQDLVQLHTLLREYGFIQKNTSISKLHRAFQCEYINKPIKIRWTKMVKGKTSKSLIFHFIDQLETLGFIERTLQNRLLFNKIETAFVDHEGNYFSNLDVSKSSWLNQRVQERTPQESELDMILYLIKSNLPINSN